MSEAGAAISVAPWPRTYRSVASPLNDDISNSPGERLDSSGTKDEPFGHAINDVARPEVRRLF